jgi:hypothetical protein
MKKLLSLCFLISLFSFTGHAQTQVLCTGKAWIHFAAVPFPLLRTLNVQLDMNGPQGTLDMDAGGDPLHYEGLLPLDGKTPIVMTDPDSGDIARLQLLMTNPQSLRFSAVFTNRQQEKIGSIDPARLTCR